MILNGWKEIAAYVNSSVRTVQRWEKAGMPVVRPLPGSRGPVIADSEQLIHGSDSLIRKPSLLRRHIIPKSGVSISIKIWLGHDRSGSNLK